MRALSMFLEDIFTGSDSDRTIDRRSVVVLAVGTVRDVVQSEVVSELRDKAAQAMGVDPAPPATVSVFAGPEAAGSVQALLQERADLEVDASVRTQDPGTWLDVPCSNSQGTESPPHRVRLVDAPQRHEIILAVRLSGATGSQ